MRYIAQRIVIGLVVGLVLAYARFRLRGF